MISAISLMQTKPSHIAGAGLSAHYGGMKAVLFASALALTLNCKAIWRLPETTPVPIDRVLTNLTQRLEHDTNNVEILHAIARLHSMAFASASTNFIVDVQTNGMPLRGHGTDLTPLSEIKHSANTNDAAVANLHLHEAIRYYQRLQTLLTNSPVPLLGLGWCYIQANEKTNAISALRRATKVAWSQERAQPALWDSITGEAIGYLLPLLDPDKDQKEISDLKELNEKALEKTGRMFTPLVLALQPNSAASDLVDTNASVAFDLDGSGVPNRRWQWITTNAVWIVHLPQGGTVTSALQMFGNVTFWLFWENGYHALASLDDNADGLVSGDELRGIKLWHDRNSDGVCDLDEILELSQLGISALDSRYRGAGQIPTSSAGAHFMDGSTRPTYDIILNRR